MVNIINEIIRKTEKWNVKYVIKTLKINKFYIVLYNK